MKPALSIIFFTVSAGAGLGLLALITLVGLVAPASLPPHALWRGALLGLALVAAGLAASVLHLANPRQAWRSFVRVRTSWLSREAVAAAALFVVGAGYVLLVAEGYPGALRVLLAFATCILAWVVQVCTAMIYASLKPIRQWRTRWTPANYLLLGHWSGALLLCALAGAYAPPRAAAFLTLATILGFAALAAKLGYWQAIGGVAHAPTLERAIGVAEGVRGPGPVSVAHARLLDTGHSHGTFLTNEFGFRVAQRHARVLRGAALALGFGLPLAWLVTGDTRWQPALAAAACCIIGLLIERWLFFAEAKHTVRLYHGDPRT
ncbi:MAG TPA: DmsC/YnfH family molybdoenzyme membrane anchor subunit [Casimicrobiaceae bacterium]|jgi:DMSO reductase anchor subunit|nr:DmsC/YnfH family molybdoenzyme membrane anchor subunit [Casimicrobiaceae bacterium]